MPFLWYILILPVARWHSSTCKSLLGFLHFLFSPVIQRKTNLYPHFYRLPMKLFDNSWKWEVSTIWRNQEILPTLWIYSSLLQWFTLAVVETTSQRDWKDSSACLTVLCQAMHLLTKSSVICSYSFVVQFFTYESCKSCRCILFQTNFWFSWKKKIKNWSGKQCTCRICR